MKISIRNLVAFTLLSGGSILWAQPVTAPQPHNVVQLSASASAQSVQDWLTITLNTSREGGDASEVQSGLKADIDAALSLAKALAVPGQLDVQSGNFSLTPRYGRDGKPMGWQGTAALVLQGRDFARISGAAGRIGTLTVGGISFSLSPELQARLEAQAQTIAIERFKARASDIARGFGLTTYTLREISVNTQEQGSPGRPRVMAMQAREALADSPVPVEAGKGAVLVMVSGSVQLK